MKTVTFEDVIDFCPKSKRKGIRRNVVWQVSILSIESIS